MTGTTVVLSLPFKLIYHPNSAIGQGRCPAEIIREELNKKDIPIHAVDILSEFDKAAAHRYHWLVGRPSWAFDDDLTVPLPHRVVPVFIRSRKVVIGEDDLAAELREVVDALFDLANMGCLCTTSKHCRLRVNLTKSDRMIISPEAFLNMGVLATAFERCVDRLLTVNRIEEDEFRLGTRSIQDRIDGLLNVKDFEELAACFTVTDPLFHNIFGIEDAYSVTFGCQPSTLNLDEMLAWIGVLIALFDSANVADFDNEVRPLVSRKKYDLTFTADDFLAAIGAHADYRKYYASRLASHIRASSTPDLPFDISTKATGSLALTRTLKELASAKARARDPRSVRQAMIRKYEEGGYGLDLLEANGKEGTSILLGELEEAIMAGPDCTDDFIAESIERDDETDRSMAMECNSLSLLSHSSDRNDEGKIDLRKRARQRHSSRLASIDSGVSCQDMDMSQLRRALPRA